MQLSNSRGTSLGHPRSTNRESCDSIGSAAVHLAMCSAVMGVSFMVVSAGTTASAAGTRPGVSSGDSNRLHDTNSYPVCTLDGTDNY